MKPADVPFADAAALANLGANVSAVKYPADARLLESVWKPIGAYHDGQAAKVALANASKPAPPIPSSALPAIAENIANEHPELRPTEVFGRASTAVSDAAARREQARQDAIAQAHRTIDTAGRRESWPTPVVA